MLRPALTALLLTTTAALAEVPRVATDIAPVHSLVAQVMGELGEPALLVRPGASPVAPAGRVCPLSHRRCALIMRHASGVTGRRLVDVRA